MALTFDELLTLKSHISRPITVTHIGSTSKCQKAFQEWLLKDTIANKIVLTVGCNTKSDDDLAAMGHKIDKDGLDILHLFKIDQSHEVLVLDITDDGQRYIGPSARNEIRYATLMGKKIRYASLEGENMFRQRGEQ